MSAAAKLKPVSEERQHTLSFEDLKDQLIGQLRELGASVYEVGASGLPTLLVGYGRRNTLLDVGGAKLASSSGFREAWQGANVRAASTLNEACAALGLRLVVRQERKRHRSATVSRAGHGRQDRKTTKRAKR